MAGRDMSAELFDAPAAPAGGRDLSSELFSGQPSTADPISRTGKILRGIRDPLDGAAQLFEHAMPQGFNDANHAVNNWLADKLPSVFSKVDSTGVDGLIKQQDADYQAQRKAGGESGFDGYRTIGNIVSPMNLAVASKLPAAASLAGRIGVGALGGGASALLNPVMDGGDFVNEKAKQVALGAAFGGAVPAIAGGVSRIISPNASKNASLELLTSEGVKPTIGQTLGGWANRMEEGLQSVPIIGDAITAARNKAKDQFNNAAVNRATAPIGEKVEGSGTQAVQNAGNLISDAYTKAKGALGNFQIDNQASQELANLQKMAAQLPKREQFQFQNAFNTLKTELTPNNSLLADGFKRIDSKLGADAAKFQGSGDAYQKQVGDAISELQRVITENAKRANPTAAKALNAADTAYANLVRVEGASVGAKGTEGVFTPGQLLTAVRGADQSVRDRATARGSALMQDLATAGQTVLGNKVPNSGTADRLMLGGGALGSYFINPAIPAGLLGGAAMYSQPMQGLLRGLVSSRPNSAQAAAQALRQTSPLLAPAGAQMGLGLLN